MDYSIKWCMDESKGTHTHKTEHGLDLRKIISFLVWYTTWLVTKITFM
jgi:hypothetical protein